jgi:hypothetical protein
MNSCGGGSLETAEFKQQQLPPPPLAMSPNSMEVMSMSLAGQFPAAYAADEVKYSTLDWPPAHRRVSASIDRPR